MKNKNVYVSPEVKGIHVLQSMRYHGVPSHFQKDDDEIKRQLEEKSEKEENEKRSKELELAKEEAYRKGRLDAEQNFKQEMEKLKTEYASGVTLLQDAAKQLTDKREKIWQESEPEIIKLVLAIANKMIGYEINSNGTNVIKHVVTEALSYVGEKKIVAIRVSPGDIKRINTLEGMKIVDQNIKILEDRTITSGGCIVETDFGNVDCQIETRWEEIQKVFLGSNNEPTVH